LLNSNWVHFTKFLESLNITRKKNNQNSNDIGMLQSTLNGSISGVCAKTIVYPFDLAKKRLQIQGFEDARKNFGKVVKFTGLFNCFYITFKQEGILGIYKGYYPSMLKAAVYSGLIFLFFESFSNIARGVKDKKVD
jgi:solute carrier family 25 thiamine pyrophosphate transporter 19